MATEEVKQILQEYINNYGVILSSIGEVKVSNKNIIGEGGNGLVYSANINEKEIAIKFLVSDDERKRTRFKSEYFNTNYVRDKLCNIVNMIHYEEFRIQDGTVIPYIIMSRYVDNLKTYRKSRNEITEEEFINLSKFFCSTLSSIHKQGIIHRDIKPENILIDINKKFVLSDFGIAHYDKEDFLINNKTKKGERLANARFSAPEQINDQYEITQTADIYSMAQVMYWFVFGILNRGTGAEQISQKYNWKDAYIYDDIINKCLRNNPEERFRSIDEIGRFYKNEKIKQQEIDPFEDMYTFHEAVLSVIPEFHNCAVAITDKKLICELLKSIFSSKYNQQIWFNTGNGNNQINSIIEIEQGNFLLEPDSMQLNIRKIWGFFTDDVYDDILLLETDKIPPYIINGEEHYAVAVIENEEIVPYNQIESGYIRYKGKVQSVLDLNIQERCIREYCKVIAIGPSFSCSIIDKNDKFIEELQKVEGLQEKNIFDLKRKIHKNRAREVSGRL